MAVALSLLIVLPTIAQTTELTDGKQSNGAITAGVFDDIRDAQLAKLASSGFPDVTPVPFVPVTTTPAPIGGVTEGQHGNGDEAYLANRAIDPQNTFFRNTLYVSNNHMDDNDDRSGDTEAAITVGAFNTVLINVANDPVLTGTNADELTCVQNNTATSDVNERQAGNALVTATVKNNSSGESITMELVGVDGGANSQAFFKVVEEGATIDHDSDPLTDEVEFRQHGGPTWCDDNKERDYVADPENAPDTVTQVQTETAATSAIYVPVDMPGINDVPLAGDAPPPQQEIATIFADHGDRLTVTTSGGSGQIELVVDGEGPEFTAVTPDDNAVTRSSRLTFSFEVRDDDSGLRHDGESVISNDGDLEEINPDGDHALHSEPLSEDPGTSVSANGAAADIDVNVVVNPRSGDVVTYDDISASGTWRMAGNRAGVAYAFSASGADRSDNPYLYQLVATDRAGNTAMTDAESGTPNEAEPYVFRVDDEEPDLLGVRTGISWDTEDNVEVVDRSYVALTFGDGPTGEDALGEVDMDNIRVVGHTIVDVIHPSKAPEINRNTEMATSPPTGPAPQEPTEPGVVTMPSVSVAGTLADGTTTYTLTPDTSCGISSTGTTPTSAEVIAATIAVSATPGLGTDETDPATAYCALWTTYRTYLVNQEAYVAAKAVYDNYHQYGRENPGRDIEKGWITEPRSRVYLELAEDLAADAEPDVVVVGGAVFDLAGNTNDAKTVEAADWIAPSLTVVVTGTANDRPVVNEDGSFSVDVRSDEDLNRRPVVFFVAIMPDQTKGGDTTTTSDDEYKYTIMDVDEASPLTQQEDENHWAKNYRRTSIDIALGADSGKLIGIIVLGEDGEDNSGATAGWTPGTHQNAANPADTNSLNLVKMDGANLLIEIDEEFNNKVATDIGEVTPRSDDKETTESANPFVKLDFAGEDGEYDLGGYEDSHDTVTVTEITLNGDDVMSSLNRVNATQFSLVLRDLAVGTHKVEYVAEDEAGNEMDDGVFTFKVNERQPYEIEVQPGWNLLSFPATPVEPGIGDVLASNQYISPVLGYQEGDWLTAIREEDGTWRGRLMEITGGYGYWMHARTFESIETMLAEVDQAATLPTVPVTAGWNLLGVLDIFQNAEGDPPGQSDAEGNFAAANYEADNYFSSIDWKVSYTYDTRQSLWVKATPGVGGASTPNDPGDDDTNEIVNGKGYWVWSPAPNTLVP